MNEQLEFAIGQLFPWISDAEYERALEAPAAPTVGAPAPPCGCEGGPLTDLTDEVLGPTCVKCGRWVR
jgi:hypothetical protein